MAGGIVTHRATYIRLCPREKRRCVVGEDMGESVQLIVSAVEEDELSNYYEGALREGL